MVKFYRYRCKHLAHVGRLGYLNQGGPTSALLWATFQNYSSLRASTG